MTVRSWYALFALSSSLGVPFSTKSCSPDIFYMDPISAAGIGIGVTSLALQVFAGCIKGYQLFREVEGMPEAYEHLRVRLQVEQCRLLSWGEKIGLVEERLDYPSRVLKLHRNLIMDILLEIHRVFRGCVEIRENFDDLVPPTTRALDDPALALRMLGDTASITVPRRFPRGLNSFMTKTLNFVDKAPQTKLRLQWAMVKHGSFKTLIEKLIGFNDSIEGLLDRGAIDELQAIQYQTNMVLLQLNSEVGELKRLSLAFQVQTLSQHAEESLSVDLKGAQEKGYESIARLADFKAQQIDLTSQFKYQDISPIPRNEVTLSNDGKVRSEASYDCKAVWVEWKDFTTGESVGSLYNDAIRIRIPKLVLLLQSPKPKEFRAPLCLGFFEDRVNDQARFGFLYAKPQRVTPDTKPVSLLELFKHDKPSLTKRIALASAISESLMFLHSVNWLHKGFRSNNIVFFPEPDHDVNYAEPILCGFDYARPDRADELTDPRPALAGRDYYRHPEATASRSKKSDDIYGLGIVLIELAYWQRIPDILDDLWDESNEASPRELLLGKTSLRRIEGNTGEVYGEVVRKCLAGGKELSTSDHEDETSPEVGQAMQIAFLDGLVNPLKKLKL